MKPGGALARFLRLESAPGILLFVFTLAALAWANSAWGHGYARFREIPIGWTFGSFPLRLPLDLFVNDALMAVFFLLVGLEIKRELTRGELSTPRQAALPLAGALGGMLVPAAIFWAWNRGGPAANGWGIPMATDIAFALGVMRLLGRRVPPGLLVFLVALAILDDLGAILVIAGFYSGPLHAGWLAAAAVVTGALVLLNRRSVAHPLPYALGGLMLWVAFFNSGVHATLSGVVLAFCIPHGASRSLSARLEAALHPGVNFGILPLFALVNAGVLLSPPVVRALGEPLGLGIVTGLCLGKPLGIVLFSAAAVRFGWARLPAGVTWVHLTGAGLLGGIGFTMSVFIAGLALPAPELLGGATFSVMTASLLAGAAGSVLLRARTSGARSA